VVNDLFAMENWSTCSISHAKHLLQPPDFVVALSCETSDPSVSDTPANVRQVKSSEEFLFGPSHDSICENATMLSFQQTLLEAANQSKTGEVTALKGAAT